MLRTQHPYTREVTVITTREASPMAMTEESYYPESLLPNEQIPLNTATVEDIARLPEIGEKTALNIAVHRSLYGDFTELEQLMDVYGIGKAIFETVKSYITLGGAPE